MGQNLFENISVQAKTHLRNFVQAKTNFDNIIVQAKTHLKIRVQAKTHLRIRKYSSKNIFRIFIEKSNMIELKNSYK